MKKRKIIRRLVKTRKNGRIFIQKNANPENYEIATARILASVFGDIEFVAPRRVRK